MARIDPATKAAAWDELIRLLLRGATIKKSAEMLGFAYDTVCAWTKTKEFKVKLMRTRALVFQKTQDAGDAEAKKAVDDVKLMIDQYAKEAIGKIADIMQNAESEAIQLRAAIDMADRSTETQKTKKIETTGKVMLFTPELLALAAAKAKEIREDHLLGKVVQPVELDASMVEVIDD